MNIGHLITDNLVEDYEAVHWPGGMFSHKLKLSPILEPPNTAPLLTASPSNTATYFQFPISFFSW